MQSRHARCWLGVEPRFCARHRARNPLPPPCPPTPVSAVDSPALSVAPGSTCLRLLPGPPASALHLCASYTTVAWECRSQPLTPHARSSSSAPLPHASAPSSIVDIASSTLNSL